MDTTLAEAIRHNLPLLRKQRSMSQAQLSARLRATGLCTWTAKIVALVEIGKQRPDRLTDVAALCQALSVPVGVLLGNTSAATHISDALAGQAVPPEIRAFRDDETDRDDLERIARLVDVDLETFQRAASVLWSTYSFYYVRDQRAGISWDDRRTLGDPTLRARRGHATRTLLAELKTFLDNVSPDELATQHADWKRRVDKLHDAGERAELAAQWALQDGIYNEDLDDALRDEGKGQS